MLRRSGSHRSGCHIASGRTVAHRRRPAGTVHGRGSGDADRGEQQLAVGQAGERLPAVQAGHRLDRGRGEQEARSRSGVERPASVLHRGPLVVVVSTPMRRGARQPARTTSNHARASVTDITLPRGCERPIFARAPHTPSPCTPRPSPPTSPPPYPRPRERRGSTASPPTSRCACAPGRSRARGPHGGLRGRLPDRDHPVRDAAVLPPARRRAVPARRHGRGGRRLLHPQAPRPPERRRRGRGLDRAQRHQVLRPRGVRRRRERGRIDPPGARRLHAHAPHAPALRAQRAPGGADRVDRPPGGHGRRRGSARGPPARAAGRPRPRDGRRRRGPLPRSSSSSTRRT